MSRFTFADAIDHLADYLGAGTSDAVQRDCRRAILAAYRDLANAHRWSYLYHHGRIVTVAPYATGTVAYQHAGGLYERMVTLSGGTWPTWAAGGYLRVGVVNWRVAQVKSPTVLTLDELVNPGVDVAAGATFKLYQDTYLLPADFIGQDQALYELNFGGMEYVHPKAWLFENRYILAEGVPQCYTVTGDSQYPGRLVMRVTPFPSESRTIDFVYHRRPRDLRIALENAGKATLASGQPTVTGTAGNFKPSMVGCIFRSSDNGTKAPTSTTGLYPATFESQVVGYVSPTQLTLLDNAPANYTGVLYTVSDPVDIEEGTMLNALLRGCEMQVALGRTLKDKPSAAPLYRQALVEAKSADSRPFSGRYVGQHGPFARRLRDMPIDLSQTF
jgi:hypothetical protein